MPDINKDFNDLNLSESEEAIKAALKYLHHYDPANENREYAIRMLKRMNEVSKGIADKSGLSFEEFVKKYSKSPEKD